MALIKLKPSQRPKKDKDFSQIQESASKSKAVYLSDYRGLSMTALTKLRTQLGTAGDLMVVKNTVFAKALAEAGKGTVDPEAIKGPSAVLFAYEDEVGILKIVTKFAKENNNLPTLKAGVFEGQFLDGNQVVALSKLPGKDQLRGQVVATLAAPLTGLVSVLNGNIRNLVYVLGQIQEKKSAA
jgi:large subunit ribosomal protein L10